MRRRRGLGRATAAFFVCPLAAVTVPWLISGGGELPAKEILLPYLKLGILLGALRLVLRPIAHLLSAPLGCLTLGFAGTVIDVLAVYFAQRYIPGLPDMPLLTAALTALVINIVCSIVT